MKKFFKLLLITFVLKSLNCAEAQPQAICPICQENTATLISQQIPLIKAKDLLDCVCETLYCKYCANVLEHDRVVRCPVCRTFTKFGSSYLAQELFAAIYSKHPSVDYEPYLDQVSELLDRRNERQENLLHVAAETDQADWVTALLNPLLSHGQQPLLGCDERHETPLHKVKTLKVAKKLLSGGANVNNANIWGSTALHIATFHGRYFIVSELLKRGANVNATNDDGRTPLHLSRSARITQELIKHGALVTARDVQQNYPLHAVLDLGCQDRECLEMLITAETLPAVNALGETPLNIVQKHGPENLEINRFLTHKLISKD
jgi:ankyrin repeat protein